jgi:MazG family protein
MTDTIGARFERLVDIMRTLRAPNGCPWDREQTITSLRPYVLEETYEVLEAIEHGGPVELREELGDFLFEAIFLARISEEKGEFDIGDVIDTVCDKLVRRHPHVFARKTNTTELNTAAEVLEHWEALKATERAQAGTPPLSKPYGILSTVPLALPALLHAYRIGSEAASVGFDWPQITNVLEKIEEEVAEVREVIETTDIKSIDRIEEEMGDLLFAIANLARKLNIEPESALRKATGKFIRRFQAIERVFETRGEAVADQTLESLELEWNRVKASSA